MTNPVSEIKDEQYRNLALWLRNSNATKDKKWLYNLCAWIIEHPTEKKLKIGVHINTILKYKQGYFKQFKHTSDNAEYMHKYYQEHKEKIKETGKKNKAKAAMVYYIYKQNELCEPCTTYIQARIDLNESKQEGDNS